ncbi:MAG TPA: hypothetical protein VF641_08010 [Methylobacterium sp.]
MDPKKRFPWDLPSARTSPDDAPSPEAASDAHLTTVVRLVTPVSDAGPPTRRSSAQDWSKLIDRIRHAAGHARDVEAQAHEQELRVQELLDRVREDMKSAGERVRAADARVADMQMRSEALMKAADERVKAAEDRARIAEEWLARVYDTIATEFATEQDKRQTA